jgi:hypothetical protein
MVQKKLSLDFDFLFVSSRHLIEESYKNKIKNKNIEPTKED